MDKKHGSSKQFKNQASDILRNRLIQTKINKEFDENDGPTLNDIGGIDYLLKDIKSKMYNVLFLDEKYNALGITNKPRVVLIYGVSGVGKKFITHCFSRQYKVPILTKYFETSLDVRELFRKAIGLERCIILLDNIADYVEENKIIVQINACIKQINTNCLVVIIHKDKNIPIMYDNEIFVKIPNLIERKVLLDKLLQNVKVCDNLDVFKIAYNTPGFVANDLTKLIKIVSTKAIERFTENDKIELIEADFDNALKEWKNIQEILTFDSIGGMERVKEELKLSILLPSQFPLKFQKLGLHKPSGILLHGPPGCGKTLIAKAISNMSHCNFLAIKGPELITKYVGDSEKHLRDLFEKAKNLSPCVLFFDEIDSICSRRGTNEFSNRIVNQILTLLDGIEDRGEVYLIGATNRIDQIDDAMLRTGRFDKVIEVPLPNANEVLEIFSKCISTIPVEEFNHHELNLFGLSGADIAGIVKEAAVLYLKDNFDAENIIITKNYFILAVEKIRKMKEFSLKNFKP